MLPSVSSGAPPRGWAVGRTFDTVHMLDTMRPAPLPHRSQQKHRRPEPYAYRGKGGEGEDTAGEDTAGGEEGRGGPDADAEEAAEELRYLRAKQAIREGRDRNLARDVNQARLPSQSFPRLHPFHVARWHGAPFSSP